MQKITPMLWYNTEAEEAAKLYTSIFRNSSIGDISRYRNEGHGVDGQVMTVSFTIDGQNFTALNGGPHFKFNEAVSLVVTCDSQAEIDEYWARLIADGGKESQCGWLKDKFGLSWQIVPSVLPKLAMGPNGGKVMSALMKMVKLDIAALERAAA